MFWKLLWPTFTVVTALVFGAPFAHAEDSDKELACLIGQAGVSLFKQSTKQPKPNAKAATDTAVKYANKHCPTARLSGGTDDAVYYSIFGMAKSLFNQGEDQ